MRNVAQRLLNGEVAQMLISWKMKIVKEKNHERGQAIMKRVTMRMINKEQAIAYKNWHDNQVEWDSKKRGKAIMKRVGMRMTKKELSISYFNWYDNLVEVKKKRRGEMMMRRVAARMTKKELTAVWDAWYRNYSTGLRQMVRWSDVMCGILRALCMICGTARLNTHDNPSNTASTILLHVCLYLHAPSPSYPSTWSIMHVPPIRCGMQRKTMYVMWVGVTVAEPHSKAADGDRCFADEVLVDNTGSLTPPELHGDTMLERERWKWVDASKERAMVRDGLCVCVCVAVISMGCREHRQVSV